MSSTLKKIIIVVVILALGYFAYSMFFKKSDSSTSLISGTNSLSNSRNLADTQILGNQITQALIQIESLTLDGSVFENQIFKSLSDKSEPISSEPVGRRNPFAPLTDTSVNFNPDLPSINTVDSDGTTDNTNGATSSDPFGDLGL